MTIYVEQFQGNNNYCTLSIEENNNKLLYIVQVCELINESLASYPFKSCTYSINDKKKAQATFKRYVKKYCMGE